MKKALIGIIASLSALIPYSSPVSAESCVQLSGKYSYNAPDGKSHEVVLTQSGCQEMIWQEGDSVQTLRFDGVFRKFGEVDQTTNLSQIYEADSIDSVSMMSQSVVPGLNTTLKTMSFVSVESISTLDAKGNLVVSTSTHNADGIELGEPNVVTYTRESI